MTFPDVAAPAWCEGRPRFHGVVIPFSVFIKPDGVPDFKVTNHQHWQRCVNEKLCGVCGQPMTGTMFFIGGDRSLVSRTFFDPAMHEDCARYAFAVCPFLIGSKDYAPTPKQAPPGAAGLVVYGWDKRPARMGFLICQDFCLVSVPGHSGPLIRPTGTLGLEWK